MNKTRSKRLLTAVMIILVIILGISVYRSLTNFSGREMLTKETFTEEETQIICSHLSITQSDPHLYKMWFTHSHDSLYFTISFASLDRSQLQGYTSKTPDSSGSIEYLGKDDDHKIRAMIADKDALFYINRYDAELYKMMK